MRAKAASAIFIAIVAALPARADDFELHGYADLRLVAHADERSYVDGGLGKTRWGAGDSALQFGGAALAATWQIAPAWLAQATAQVQTTDESGVDLVEAYLRWRPVSTTRMRWSVRLGAFFPPVSLENDGIGWTSRYTLTPSAINTWIGEEFRTFGAEVAAEWRGERATLDARVAVFGANDPAGELLAARGWSLSDLHYGYGASVREPDALSLSIGTPAPLRFDPYVENDDRLGWYAGLEARTRDSRLTVLRYDNNADPTTESHYGRDHEVYSWRTEFWALGAQKRFERITLLAQAISGSTEFEPSPFFHSDTRFAAAYVLAGWESGAWRPAVRFDVFQARQGPDSLDDKANEHGNAVTLALSWRPREWLRLTGEALRVQSARTQRVNVGSNEREVDTQLQLGARLLW